LMFAMFRNTTAFNQCLGTWASKTQDSVITKNMFLYSGCPNQGDPDPDTIGPWCQDNNDKCGVVKRGTSSGL